jgi:uncharacterized spore protein YtfJ
MDVRGILATAQDAMSVKRVFGEPFAKNEVTIIPAARVWGGAGGGLQDRRGSVPGGQGGGFGIRAKPAGAYVVRGENVRWVPAVDANQIVAGFQALALVVFLVRRRRHRGRPGHRPGPRGRQGVEPALVDEASGAPGQRRPAGPAPADRAFVG